MTTTVTALLIALAIFLLPLVVFPPKRRSVHRRRVRQNYGKRAVSEGTSIFPWLGKSARDRGFK